MSKIYISKTSGTVLLLLLFVLSLSVLFVLYTAYNGREVVSPSKRLNPLGSTFSTSLKKTLKVADEKNGKSKLTIVFYYEEYESQEKALTDIELLKKAISLVEPFASLSDHISYEVFTSDTAKCRVDTESKYLVCDKELIDSFKKLGVDRFKVVLMSQKDFVSAAQGAHGKNSWISISTNPIGLSAEKRNEWLGLMMTRLLGYSLGLSYETGEDTTEQQIPAEAVLKSLSFVFPNCVPDLATAKNMWGGYKDVAEAPYFKGCAGHKDYYYPVENTLMSLNPKKESYGVVSEDYVRAVLTCFYGESRDIVFPAGKEKSRPSHYKTCATFIAKYPNFWKE